MNNQQPPNILLIHSDQHRFDCTGANGHPLVQTPAIDRLAAEGANFVRAFTPSPICSPARGSLITGLWPTQHGCIDIPNTEGYHPMHRGLDTTFQLLHAAGYSIRYVGKFHQETAGPPTDYGVDEFVSDREYPKWRQEKGLPPVPNNNGWFGECDAHITPAQSRMAWGVDHAIRMMEESVATGKPFFVRWDPVEPHLPCKPPEPYASMYPPHSIPPWPSFADSLEGKAYVQRLQRRRWGLQGRTWEDWAPVVSRYLGEISLLDAQLGRLLEALDRLGVAANTLAMYTTDHGDFCGGHGMMDKHFTAYDDIMRVPLVVRFPGRIPAGTVCRDFVSHSIDVATTTCAAAGLPVPDQFEGMNLVELANGGVENPRHDIFAMYQGCQMGLWSTRMIRDERYKLVYHATGEPELYDLQTDPGELHNRVEDTALGAPLDRLKARLIDWMESIRDPLLNPWTRRHITECLP